MTERTGPKISSWPIRSIAPTPEKIVGSKKWPCVRSPSGRAAAAGDELALAAADVDVRRDLVDRAGVDERPDVGRVVEARPEAQLASARLQPLEERLDDRAVDDHARARRAALAGRPEGGPQDPVGREVEVGVLEHDDAVLAAELQGEPLEPPAGLRPRSTGPVADEPVNEMTADVGVIDDRVADLGAAPVTRLTTPGGKPASAMSSTRSVAQCGVSLPA